MVILFKFLKSNPEDCAEEVIRSQGRCNSSLWDILYNCSALPDLDDESGRTCFVQGHDRLGVSATGGGRGTLGFDGEYGGLKRILEGVI